MNPINELNKNINEILKSNNIRNKKINYLKNDTCIGKHIELGLYWEEWMLNYLVKYYIKGSNMIDIGGNIGTTSMLMSEILTENNFIYTFEPIYYDVIYKNIFDNNLQDKIKVYPCGLSNNNNSIFINNINYDNKINYGAVSLENEELTKINNNNKLELIIKKLDDFNLNNISLIKIDVENMEIKVLQGAINILKKNRPTLLLECHIIDEFLFSDIWKVMKDELNYKYIKINNLNDYIFYITD